MGRHEAVTHLPGVHATWGVMKLCLTCQGIMPRGASFPPTMRLRRDGAREALNRPHSPENGFGADESRQSSGVGSGGIAADRTNSERQMNKTNFENIMIFIMLIVLQEKRAMTEICKKKFAKSMV